METTLAWGVGLYLFIRIALFAVLGYWVFRSLRPEPREARARSDEQSRYAHERRHGAGRRG